MNRKDPLYPVIHSVQGYLLESGFERHAADPGYAKFVKGDMRIFFTGMGCIVEMFHDEEPGQRSAGWSRVGAISGEWVAGLSLNHWVLILDGMKAVSIKENVKKANAHVQPLIANILNSFNKAV